MIIVYIILGIIAVIILSNVFWNKPLDNFAIAIKKIYDSLEISLDKGYKITEDDDQEIRQAIVINSVGINPMTHKGLLFFLQNSISWFAWHNARDATYQVHMDVARWQFGVDVREDPNKYSKDQKILEKHFWY